MAPDTPDPDAEDRPPPKRQRGVTVSLKRFFPTTRSDGAGGGAGEDHPSRGDKD